MHELKFRYIIKNNFSGKITTKIMTLEEIENSLPKLLTSNIILARNQFTGLLDSNEIEIYEGDIVTILWPESLNEKLYVVDCKQSGPSGFPTWKFWNVLTEYSYSGSAGGNVKVIGNIHENPQIIENYIVSQ